MHDATTIRLIPATVALRWHFFKTSSFDFYLGAGPRYTYVKVRNHSRYVKGHLTKQGLGALGELGLLWFMNEWFAFDFHIDYSYVRVNNSSKGNIEGTDLNVGGLSAGLGLSFKL